jgi:hypothetical protein
MSQSHIFESPKTSYKTAPVWSSTWTIKIRVKSSLIRQIDSIWKSIVSNLNLFSISQERERIITTYISTTYNIEPEDMINFISKLEVYSSGRIILNYRSINEYMKQAVSSFDFTSSLVVYPFRTLKINPPTKGFLEVAQINYTQLISTNCEGVENVKELLDTIIRSSDNVLLCEDNKE